MMCALTGPAPRADGDFEIVHAFDHGTDGNRPQTAVIQAVDGNFYGTTALGGLYGDGSIPTQTSGSLVLPAARK
jgi:hypothetical protein